MTTPQVLHLRSSIGLYGAENVVLGLMPALMRDGIPNRLLCLQTPGDAEQLLYERALELGVPAAVLPCRGRLDWHCVKALRAEIAATPQAVLHVHDYKSAFYGWLARSGRALPIVSTSHGQFNDSQRLRLYHRIELMLMRRFERVCAVSDAMTPLLLAAGVAEQRIRVIENGIDTTRFHPQVPALERAALGIPPGRFVFGTAMRLAEPKFPLGLVEAYAASRERAGEAVLMIAGDGPMRAAVQARAAELGVADELILLGARKDLERIYGLFDCFVLPSLSEGLPMALLEAMATARPVIATTVGQVGEVLAGLPATLLPPGDVAALSRALRAARQSPERDPRVGAALRERVEQRYSVTRMAADYAAVYRQLAEG
ncbi:MAG TPA: glycosyltransferase family 4 protein [Ideonella sp.]|nr:glycosyltransferase family 4 protein [Ideonella sp.]